LDRLARSRGQALLRTGGGRVALGIAALGVVYGDIGTSPLSAPMAAAGQRHEKPAIATMTGFW